MPNPRLAERYAKSLIDFAIEQNQLDIVYSDMEFLLSICKVSSDFIQLLRSPIVKASKKNSIITAVAAGKISETTSAFVRLLTNKGRESNLPEIAVAFINQYNVLKGIQKIKLTTSIATSDKLKEEIISNVKSSTGFNNIQLETAVNQNIIGGYILEYNNNLIDASVLNKLNNIKKQFLTPNF